MSKNKIGKKQTVEYLKKNYSPKRTPIQCGPLKALLYGRGNAREFKLQRELRYFIAL